MAFLEIIDDTGKILRRELTKQTTLTIGAHPSNDICINEDDVEIMACRISWGRKGFEAVAAGAQPLDVNGTPMQKNLLLPGDVLRFGSVDIRFRESENDGAQPAQIEINDLHPVGLKPVAEELKSVHPPILKAPPPSVAPPAGAGGKGTAAAKQESPADRAAPGRRGRTPGITPVQAPSTEPAAVTAELVITPDEPEVENALTDRVRAAMRSQQRRPGEEDPLRSPLVLGLTGGAAALMLAGAIFYFIATRQSTQQAFDAAKHYYDEGNYHSSIEALQNFIVDYPRHPLAVEAKRLLGQSRIRQLIDSATPKYAEGLNELRSFIDEQKDIDGFETLHQSLMSHAKTISLGAAVSAGKIFNPELLEISRQATTILKTYAPKDVPPTEMLDQIEQAVRSSEAAIMRDDVFKEHLAAIDAALVKQAPLAALQRRRDLLIRYPEFQTDKSVGERMQKTLEAERQRVVLEELDTAALTTDHAWPGQSLTLVFQGRTRTDEVAIGKAVLVCAQDCSYGLEFVTGQPLWRRVTGYDAPFFPLVEPGTPSVILYDTIRKELVRLNQNTGKLIWRQPIPSGVVGKPLLAGDTLYVSTRGRQLLSIRLNDGQLTAALTFSQPVGSPVELDDTQRLVVAGKEEVLYVLTKRPFACAAVFDLGQKADSVQAPLLAMATYLLAIENGTQQATLHLLQSSAGGAAFREVATAQVRGRVLDAPVIRGRDLFVPSSGERVSAFSLSDDAGQPPLTPGPTYQGEGKLKGATFLLPGPDRQLWMASSALAKMRLTTAALQLDGNPVASGVATQPLQYVSGFLFNVRRRPYTDAVTVTRTDRDELTSDWQVTLGGRILAWAGASGNNLNISAVTGAGQTFRIGNKQLADSSFLTEAAARLVLPQDLSEPLLGTTVSNNRLAVVCGGAQPRMWLINSAGQLEGSPQLPQPPQGPPCPMGNDVLVPSAGRIHVIRGASQPPVQDFALPTAETPRWVGISPLSDQRAAAVTAPGSVLLLRIDEAPRPHLAEAGRVELGQSVNLPAASDGDRFAVADVSQRVSLFNANLEIQGKRQFEQAVTSSPRLAGGKLFVELASRQLLCLEPDEKLSTNWSIELPETSIVGILPQQNEFHIAFQNGTVLTVEARTGQASGRIETGNYLSMGPLSAGGNLFVATPDGSIIRLPGARQGAVSP